MQGAAAAVGWVCGVGGTDLFPYSIRIRIPGRCMVKGNPDRYLEMLLIRNINLLHQDPEQDLAMAKHEAAMPGCLAAWLLGCLAARKIVSLLVRGEMAKAVRSHIPRPSPGPRGNVANSATLRASLYVHKYAHR